MSKRYRITLVKHVTARTRTAADDLVEFCLEAGFEPDDVQIEEIGMPLPPLEVTP